MSNCDYLCSDLTDLDKEIEILSRLQSHPNVVTLLGYCDDPESYMLVMEYVEGANLDQLIGRRLHRDISQWTQRLDVSSQIAEGLHYIHSQNPPIIHMDLSSHNVLVEINQSSNSGVKFLCKVLYVHDQSIYTYQSQLSLNLLYLYPDYGFWIVKDEVSL